MTAEPLIPEVPLALMGPSPLASKLRSQVARLADSPAPVLITGARHAGQADIAYELHLQSARHIEPFLRYDLQHQNADALDRALFLGSSSPSGLELLGAGTLYLEAIDQASPGLLQKVTRYIDDGSVLGANTYACARILCSVTGDELPDYLPPAFLRAMRCPTIEVPPLDDRMEDLPAMVRRYLSEVSSKEGVSQIDTLAMQAICDLRFKHNLLGLRTLLWEMTLDARAHGQNTLHAYQVKPAAMKLEALDDVV